MPVHKDLSVALQVYAPMVSRGSSVPELDPVRMVSLSHSASESSIWSIRRDVGLSSPGVQSLL